MPRETGRTLVAQNKKARHDYQIGETYEAGLVLTGTEVKTEHRGTRCEPRGAAGAAGAQPAGFRAALTLSEGYRGEFRANPGGTWRTMGQHG